MKPWLKIYRGRCAEVRFGWLGVQGGFTLPHISFVLWRNKDYSQLLSFRWGRWLAVLLIALSLSACASAPVAKDTAIVSLQASNVALSNAADAERALCFVNPQTESGPHCTNPLAAASGLTDARHASATDLLITGLKDQKIAGLSAAA